MCVCVFDCVCVIVCACAFFAISIISAISCLLLLNREVETSLANAERIYERWKQMYERRSSNDEEFQHTTEQLRTTIKSIEWDLEDLAETVNIAAKEPEKFNLTESELALRRAFIDQSKHSLKVGGLASCVLCAFVFC